MAVKFLIDNWLMAVSAVGFLEILAQHDPELYRKVVSVQDRYLLVDKNFWDDVFPDIYEDWAKKNRGLLISFHKNNVRVGGNIAIKSEPPYLRFQTGPLSEFLCQFCLERKAYFKVDGRTVRVFEREIFTPLGSSDDIPSNFSGGRNNLYICKECESLIYCSSAGFTRFRGSNYFLYVEEDPITLWKLNSYFKRKVEGIKRDNRSVIQEFLDMSFLLLSKVASIRLSRIYLVELSSLGQNFNVYSSHLPREIIEVLNNYLSKFPTRLESIYSDVLKQAKGRNLYPVIIRLLEGWSRFKKDKKETSSGRDEYMRISKNLSLYEIDFLLRFQKELEGGYTMNGNVYADIARKISASTEERQRQKLVYDLLRHIRQQDVHGFVERLLFELNKVEGLQLDARERKGLEKLALGEDFKSASLVMVAHLVGGDARGQSGGEEDEEFQSE